MRRILLLGFFNVNRVRCSPVVRAFAHGAMGRRIDPSWGGPIEISERFFKGPVGRQSRI